MVVAALAVLIWQDYIMHGSVSNMLGFYRAETLGGVAAGRQKTMRLE